MTSIKSLRAEIRRRSEQHLRARRLVVDYYRIRRRLAFPLPLEQPHPPLMEVFPEQEINDVHYPWFTWMMWALEERIGVLSLAGTWLRDANARRKAEEDLLALAGWKAFRQYPNPDLAIGHAARILWNGHQCPWLKPQTREAVGDALRRLADEGMPALEAHFAGCHSKTALLHSGRIPALLHNIAFIGAIGIALAATTIRHPRAAYVNKLVWILVESQLEQRAKGFSEGTGYDAYLLDFVADWLMVLPAARRNVILDHPQIPGWVSAPFIASAPGNILQTAPLGDVEPVQMCFAPSAAAKLYQLKPVSEWAWYLRRCLPSWMTADALGALLRLGSLPAGQAPPCGVLSAHSALVLRRQWNKNSLALAASASSSPMSHIHTDYGSVVIGVCGEWFLSDPGYQQYVKNSERTFTTGTGAHNTPVINGHSQTQKSGRILRSCAKNDLHTVLNITRTYPPEAGAPSSILRHLWLCRKETAVICDEIKGGNIRTLHYAWHGHPEAAWWIENGWAGIHLNDKTLWFASPQAEIQEGNLTRLRGSRGHLTLKTEIDPSENAIWWVFCLAERPPALTIREKSLHIGQKTSLHL